MTHPVTTKVTKLYAQRSYDECGEQYAAHVNAMTAERLETKSAIAWELAHRDWEIEKLRTALTASEKPRITVGAFVLTPCEDPRFVGIAHESGEAGTFKVSKLEERLADFWSEEF